MGDRTIGAFLLGFGGWFQRRKAQRAASSLLPPENPEHRNAGANHAWSWLGSDSEEQRAREPGTDG